MRQLRLYMSTLLFSASLLLISEACDVLPDGSPCRCEFHLGKNIINCRSKGLTQVPDFNQDPTVYDELTLARNNIGSLKNFDFSNLKVKLVDISDNPVALIESNAFDGLNDNLEELILHVDGISSSGFPTQALSELTSLQVLQLKGFNMNSLPNNAITALINLRELHFESCGLQQLTTNDVQGQRDTLEVLDLTGNDFESVPSAAVKSLQQLNKFVLASNGLNMLQNDAFQGVADLRDLDLSQNSIGTVQSNAFRGLEDLLQTLRMHHCGLQQQQLMAMENLRNLATLDLAHNSISGIPSDFFSAMSKLQEISFASNSISSLEVASFTGLENALKKLELQDNNLGSIQANTFAGLRYLHTLDLSSQSQSLAGELNENTFRGLGDTLESLGLAGVGFTDQNWPSITDLLTLKTVNLASNQIQNAPDGTFKNLQRLEVLTLTSNQLGTLTQSAMHGLEKSLQSLRVDKNEIEVIDHCVFADFEQLSSLDLHDNPLQCDCQLRWLREWTLDLSLPDQDSIQWECASPPQHQGQKFMSLEPSDFQCDGGDAELPECLDFTPTTTTTTSVQSTTESLEPQPVHVMVENATHAVIHISWSVQGAHDITGFSIQYFELEHEDDVQEEVADKHARIHFITGLKAASSYYICVAVVDSNPDTENKYSCVDAKTEPEPLPVEESNNSTAIIVSAILGAIVLVAIILIVVFCVRRHCQKDYFEEDDEGGFVRGKEPQLGYQSKRFSKPRPDCINMQNYDNQQSLEKKLEGFTQEERDRIINLFTNSGASTLSMISNSDPQRYVPEPPAPRGAVGYDNPSKVNDENFYFEIDEQDDNYDQIPADGAGAPKRGREIGSVYI